MEHKEKIEALKEKLIERISKALDKETLTSRELYDYTYIIGQLKSSEQYSDILAKGFAGFNGGYASRDWADKKDEELD